MFTNKEGYAYLQDYHQINAFVIMLKDVSTQNYTAVKEVYQDRSTRAKIICWKLKLIFITSGNGTWLHEITEGDNKGEVWTIFGTSLACLNFFSVHKNRFIGQWRIRRGYTRRFDEGIIVQCLWKHSRLQLTRWSPLWKENLGLPRGGGSQ